MSTNFDAQATFKELGEAIIRGDAKTAEALTRTCIDRRVPPEDIVNEGFIPGMDVVGERFRRNEYYVPEVLISARAMKTGMALVRPLLAESGVQPVGKVVIATVRGDLHDIGKNLCAMMLEGAGFEVYDLGIDCSADKFVEKAKDVGANIIAMSALLTTTMVYMRNVVQAVKDAGLQGKIKTIVGGAPVTQDWANEIGADGYAPDAASTVTLSKRLCGVEVKESQEETGRRVLLEARDMFESAIRLDTPAAIKKAVGDARARAEDAKKQGADKAAADRLLAAIDRELAQHA